METMVTFTVEDGRAGQITIQRSRRPIPQRVDLAGDGATSSVCIDAAQQVQELRALIVTGAGGAFCAGGDLFELDGYLTRLDGARLSGVMAQALDRLEDLPMPTIAAIEGPALGGGAEIAMACDLPRHGARRLPGMMHVRLAISPAWGGAQRLLRLAGYARSPEWLAAGKVFATLEALEAGLINRVASLGEALVEALFAGRSVRRQRPGGGAHDQAHPARRGLAPGGRGVAPRA